MLDALPGLDRVKLREQLLVEFDRAFKGVVDAVDDAAAGRLIRDSEEPARDALDEFRRAFYERVLQAKVNAAEAAFPPSGQRNDRQTETS